MIKQLKATPVALLVLVAAGSSLPAGAHSDAGYGMRSPIVGQVRHHLKEKPLCSMCPPSPSG